MLDNVKLSGCANFLSILADILSSVRSYGVFGGAFRAVAPQPCRGRGLARITRKRFILGHGPELSGTVSVGQPLTKRYLRELGDTAYRPSTLVV